MKKKFKFWWYCYSWHCRIYWLLFHFLLLAGKSWICQWTALRARLPFWCFYVLFNILFLNQEISYRIFLASLQFYLVKLLQPIQPWFPVTVLFMLGLVAVDLLMYLSFFYYFAPNDSYWKLGLGNLEFSVKGWQILFPTLHEELTYSM